MTTNTTSNTTNTSTNDSVIDDDDIEMFKLNYGMEVRLLQLEKRLISHIIMGNIIIAEINNSDIDVNTSVLKAKIEGLEEIKDEIDEELSKDPVNVSTERFVELKAEAINLTFEFKKELYSLLTPQQIQSIKKEIPKKMSRHAAELKVLDDDLIDKIKKYNYHKSAELMKKFGLSQDELEDRMKDENVSAKELKEILKNEYKSLTKEKKKEVLHDLKDNKEKAILKKTIMYGNRLGLDQEEMDEILNDESLTWEEKEAKLRILSKEKMNNGKSDEDEKGSSGKNDDNYEKEYKSKDKSKNEKRGRN